MEFSPQQEQALEAVHRWLSDPNGSPVFRLFGYAGTGKTTIAKELGADFYAAYTGKAALVLRQKGCHNASTIHKLIYTPWDKNSDRAHDVKKALEEAEQEWAESAETDRTDAMKKRMDQLRTELKKETEQLKQPAFVLNIESPLNDGGLLAIDECSMVGETMAEDLLSFGTRILVLGDPAQLPPVKGTGYFTDAEPDFLLTEVHRQARDNPILDLATIVRESGRLPNDHPCMVNRITREIAMESDQVIVGKNDTRRGLNQRIRSFRGFTDQMPMVGEKLVCLKNNHDRGLLNGGLHEVTDVYDEAQWPEYRCQLDGWMDLMMHREPFVGGEVDYWAMRDKEVDLFDFGYVLTCHKSQGSQWEKVAIVNESGVFRQHKARWLYTAITRAAKELKIA